MVDAWAGADSSEDAIPHACIHTLAFSLLPLLRDFGKDRSLWLRAGGCSSSDGERPMASIERLHRTAPLDLARIEEDVVGSLPAIRAARSGPRPDYVEHEEGVTRFGALPAEAVVRDYETAAREIEAMGAELISAAKKCEAMTAEVHNAIAFMRDTAASYREEAKKIFKRIEECAIFTEQVRKTCETVKLKMIEGKV